MLHEIVSHVHHANQKVHSGLETFNIASLDKIAYLERTVRAQEVSFDYAAEHREEVEIEEYSLGDALAQVAQVLKQFGRMVEQLDEQTYVDFSCWLITDGVITRKHEKEEAPNGLVAQGKLGRLAILVASLELEYRMHLFEDLQQISRAEAVS